MHIGSEGEVAMLAGNLGEFLMFTTFGFDPFADPEELDGPAHEEGCAFLVERGVEVPTSAVAVVEWARAAHPDLNAWVYGRLKS